MNKYNRKYPDRQEMLKRYQIFQENLKTIETLNSQQKTARFGINKFADLSSEEFRGKYLMPKFHGPTQPKGPKINLPTDFKLPESFDWRDKGAVTPVYDQGQCGSCWAFSATEAIESQWFLSGHSLPQLSVQQIVDCDTAGQDEGCNGGDTPTAYKYVIGTGGLESSQVYPYTAEDDPCRFNRSSVVAHISSWGYVTQNHNETEMQVGLVAKGPLSICVDAASWQFYIGGVISMLCGTDLDHCVMITGFEDYNDWPYGVYKIWLIRNSWGEDWGENGYIYVERGYDLCGVSDEVTLPIV
jgi:cathepsin F